MLFLGLDYIINLYVYKYISQSIHPCSPVLHKVFVKDSSVCNLEKNTQD